MAFIIENLTQPDKDWDKRVELGDGDIYQTTTYAKFQEECLGMKTKYLLVKEKEEILAQIMLTYGPRFAKYLKKTNIKIRKFFEKHFVMFTSIRGPIILNKEKKEEIYDLLLDKTEELARRNYAIKNFSLPINEDKKVYELFLKRGFYQDAWGTTIVNTQLTEEELWKNIQKSRRNLVRRGKKQNLIFKKAETREDFEKAISIIKDMSKRNNIFAHTDAYYEKFFEIFSKFGFGETFLVEHGDRPLATLTIYKFNNKAIQTALAYNQICIEEKISATDFLEWNTIKYCKENNLKSYDLAGIRPESKKIKDINLREYKLRWGGEEIYYPYFSKEYSLWKKIFIRILLKTMKKRYQTR